MVEAVIFYFLATVVICFAFMMVTTRYLLRSAVYLMFTLLPISWLYMLIDSEFLAAAQILVYVGGIVAITLYAILLTSRVGEQTRAVQASQKKRRALFTTAFLMFVLASVFLSSMAMTTLSPPSSPGNTKQIALAFLSLESNGFILPFELVSLILLAAFIGAIIIARVNPAAGVEDLAEKESA